MIQIAEWLEELKELREIRDTIKSNANALEQNGYNKAIDEFVKKLHNEYHNYRIDGKAVDYWYDRLIDEIAEQLKAGGNNNGF